MGLIFLLITVFSYIYSLNSIKSKTVGDGQHGTARFATKGEIRKTYKEVPFEVELWRNGKNLPTIQGTLVGQKTIGGKTTALIDDGDVHTLMIGAAGVGKTAYFLYPNLEYACASEMSFVTSDTKGDLYRNYGAIAKKYYGYNVSVIDLRNPTKSDGFNLLHLVNKYMDLWKEDSDNLSYKAKAEKYAKITSKTIISSGGDNASYGQNAYFYDAAEGLLTSAILLVSEFCPKEKRHIVTVFKIIQELMSNEDGKKENGFVKIMELLPNEHKAKWFAGAALNTSDQSMASVVSTALSRLNTFLDSEMEAILCFNTSIDAEKFCNEKSAIFLVMPEEDSSKYFMISLIVQQLYREMLLVADEKGGKLDNRVMMYLDEMGTIPKIESAEMMFSASRSRRISIIAIIQSFAQLNQNYGEHGAEIITDNTQLTIFGGFAPNSKSAEILSKAMGSRTVMILKTAETHYAGCIVLTMLYCGLRPIEVRRMEWSWIDFENSILTVGKSKTQAGTGRKIPIPPQLKSELIKHRFKRQNEQYVFVRVKNHNLPMDENAFYHAWHNFKREMDISNGAKVYRNQIIESTLSEDLEPYLLRHTFCTDCQAAGVPINVAKELMGHSDISVTAKIYTHMVDEVFEQNRKRLQEYAEHKQNQTVTA